MRIIVGLGNPGKEYENTRHNMGFMVVDALAKRYRLEKETNRFDGIIGETHIGSEKVLLVKPLTYMNLSGKTVQPLMHWYKAELEDLMVVYDDMDLEVSALRIREKGSAGGHNGMKSIIQLLGSEQFSRMRVGIGRPKYKDDINHVLGKFVGEEKTMIDAAVEKACDALEVWIKEDTMTAMNRFNEKKKKKAKEPKPETPVEA